MRNKIEVHNYQKRLEGVLKRIDESSIDKEDKSLILDFMNDCFSRSLSKARVVKCLDTIERIAKLLGKPFKRVAKEDIVRLIREIDEKDYTDWTKGAFQGLRSPPLAHHLLSILCSS